MTPYKLSYVLTTYNKLPYLQHVMRRLVAARQEDEEIVVCDGGSKDGTTDYLQNLYDTGQIQQYVSERDKGEAHGFNKGFLRAKGEIIKLITDDDAYYYPVIRQAANYMLQHPTVDVMLGYNATTQLEDLRYAGIPEEPAHKFKQWLTTKEPFSMIGLSLMIRRNSLAITGLFSTSLVLVDFDFLYRISSAKVNLAWCNAVMCMHLSNPDGNFNRMGYEAIVAENNRVMRFYEKDKPDETDAQKLRQALQKSAHNVVLDVRWSIGMLKRPLVPVKRMVYNILGKKVEVPIQVEPKSALNGTPTNYVPLESESALDAAYRVCDEFLVSCNASKSVDFLYEENSISKVLK